MYLSRITIFTTVFIIILSLMTLRFAMAELQDPTRPHQYSGMGLTDSGDQLEEDQDIGIDTLLLTSTLITENRKLATINGRLVNQGDKLGNMKVIAIKPMKALLRNENTNVVITLIQKTVKKAVVSSAN